MRYSRTDCCSTQPRLVLLTRVAHLPRGPPLAVEVAFDVEEAAVRVNPEVAVAAGERVGDDAVGGLLDFVVL